MGAYTTVFGVEPYSYIANVIRGEDAHLIAAAPDLLSACLHAIARLKQLDEYRKTDSSASIGLIERAIAKAEGRE